VKQEAMAISRKLPQGLRRMSGILVVATAIALSLWKSVNAFDASHWIEVHGGAWHPQPSSLPDIEQVLRPAVAAAMHGKRLPAWKDYTFQFQGRASPLGKHIVFVNAFCDSSHYRLTETWVQVFGGGACFFSAKYDPEHDGVYDLVINGEG
jgi:hypothetical protein